MHTTQEGPQCCERSDIADQLIEASGACAADRITIAGSRNLGLLLTLCGRGFSHAACQAVNQECPHDAQSAADILLIPDIADVAELSAVLARLGCVLHRGGTLALHACGDRETATQLRRLLVERGYTPIAWTAGTARRHDLIMTARKCAAAPRAQAA